MAHTFPAMRGQIGTTKYYVACLKVGYIVDKVKMPAKVEGWDQLSMTEQWQRDPDFKRIETEIAPYFATDNNRFSGALILAVQSSKKIDFEPAPSVLQGNGKGFIGAHKTAAENLGFINFTDAESLIPIDGQHRAKALQYAKYGKNDDNEVLDFDPNAHLGEDDVVAILIEFKTPEDQKKARYIFSKINRYGKTPSTKDKIITDDDDVVAIVTRHMLDSEKYTMPTIPLDLVERKAGNTLSNKSGAFTTLSMLYRINEIILRTLHPDDFKGKKSTQLKFNKAQTDIFQNDVEQVWSDVLKGIQVFKSLVEDPTSEGDEVRGNIREKNLLAKPFPQAVLLNAFLQLTATKNLPTKQKQEIFNRLNKIDWTISNPMWRGTLTSERDRVATGGLGLSSEFIVYLVGGTPNKTEQEELRKRINENPSYTLPDPVA